MAWTEELATALKEAGAEDSVTAAIREVAPVPPVPKPPPSPVAGQIRMNAKDGLPYAWIPSGSFTMGCADGHSDCHSDEKPAHRVRISRGFWMGQTEVTVAAYKRFVAASGGTMPEEPKFNRKRLNAGWQSGNLPMTMVNWHDAQSYCRWAGLRLPTEAEWEYAARAGAAGQTYGDLDAIAWSADNSGNQRLNSRQILSQGESRYVDRLSGNENRARPVAQKQANAWRLYDVLGNAWEWVADWHDGWEYGRRGGEAVDPAGPTSGTRETLRGGSWNFNPGLVRLSNRNHFFMPADRSIHVGFRCAGESTFP